MIPIFESWTIVIVGQWNTRIFSPKWVGENLFRSTKVASEISIAPSSWPVRYISDNITFIPKNDRIIIGVKNAKDETLKSAETVAKIVMELLGHTPVSAMGVNFGYVEDSPSDEFLALYNLNDISQISAAGCSIAGTRIVRKLELDDNIINMSISYDSTKIDIHMNFHHDISLASEAIKALDGNVVKYGNITTKLLKEIYDLRLNSED
jgi:hypothetical protein